MELPDDLKNLRISDKIVWAKKDTKTQILEFEQSDFLYEVDGLAQEVFELISKGKTAEEAVAYLTKQRPDFVADYEDEIVAFLQELALNGIIF